MSMTEWVRKVEEQRCNVPTVAHPSNCKVFYKVPSDVREGQDQSVFNPLKVSIGPYHHGKESLRSGQSLKEEQCLPHFLNRNTDQRLRDVVDALAPQVDQLRDMYDQLDPAWLEEKKKDDFLQMMVVDGCFLLELMFHKRPGGSSSVSFNPNEMDSYRHDIMLFENQIPMKVLLDLASMIYPGREFEFNTLISMADFVRDLSPFGYPHNQLYSHGSHILDCYQKGLVTFAILSASFYGYSIQNCLVKVKKKYFPCCFSIREKDEETFTTLHFNIPSATELKEAQIEIRMSKTPSLMDISLSHTTLRLPQINLDDTTKYTFHNLILLERLCPHVEMPLGTSYVYFMNGLLKAPEDISLLRMRGIINTTLPDAEVADLFHGLRKCIRFSPDISMITELLEVGQSLRERYNKNSEEWRKDLLQRYLRSPWAIISIIVGFLIFIFTATQTIYSVLTYYKGK